jgi:hypothetical protein
MKRRKLDDQFSSCFCDPPFRAAWRTKVRHAVGHKDERIEKPTTDWKRGYIHSLSRVWVFSVQLTMLHEIHEWAVSLNLLSQAFL